MNGHKLELEWTQGSAPHKAWAEDEEGARLVMEALKLHPSVESVRLVALIEQWKRPDFEIVDDVDDPSPIPILSPGLDERM